MTGPSRAALGLVAAQLAADLRAQLPAGAATRCAALGVAATARELGAGWRGASLALPGFLLRQGGGRLLARAVSGPPGEIGVDLAPKVAAVLSVLGSRALLRLVEPPAETARRLTRHAARWPRMGLTTLANTRRAYLTELSLLGPALLGPQGELLEAAVGGVTAQIRARGVATDGAELGRRSPVIDAWSGWAEDWPTTAEGVWWRLPGLEVDLLASQVERVCLRGLNADPLYVEEFGPLEERELVFPHEGGADEPLPLWTLDPPAGGEAFRRWPLARMW